MISFNSISISQHIQSGILLEKHISVQAASVVNGLNIQIQYLRRMLRSGTLEGVKIGQKWLIDMESLEAYLEYVERASDRRCGPRIFFKFGACTFVKMEV
jgi:excisionase family DNA binding protein